ncbi:hypothetical protein GOEFS_018_01110 [Gordonia effusa NBRC 100432]|uniref:Uncharacterized protein n=1 Tax=Gordonia effusa NBRC 100432 TaxID=1077974 RepID=H0QW78_9ACTN|nr:hypothetical protein [Gordonia effusa]GAB17079.1 hypothetical protein GOEFS_018_01110 [Gordonia effusa NBRC 100432]
MTVVTSPNSLSPARRGGTALDAATDDDVDLMNYLVAVGRVAQPDSDAWRSELLGLTVVARRNLAHSEGTFVMGEQFVRLFRVTRNDIAVAARQGSRPRTPSRGEADDAPTQPIALMQPHPEFTPRSSIPRGRMPTPADLEPLPSEVRPPRRPRVRPKPTVASRMLFGAASALLAAAVGTVLIAAWSPDSEPVAQTVAQTQTHAATSTVPTTVPTAKAQDVALARRPAATYKAPQPTTTQRSETSASPNNSRRTTSEPRRQPQRSAPKPRTVPNPIPGLPPIRLP